MNMVLLSGDMRSFWVNDMYQPQNFLNLLRTCRSSTFSDELLLLSSFNDNYGNVNAWHCEKVKSWEAFASLSGCPMKHWKQFQGTSWNSTKCSMFVYDLCHQHLKFWPGKLLPSLTSRKPSYQHGPICTVYYCVTYPPTKGIANHIPNLPQTICLG